MADWMATYLRAVSAHRVRPYTLHRYAEEVDLHIVPALGRIKLDKLRPEHLSTFYRQKSETLAASSVRRLHAVIRRALNVAVRWNVIAVNPATLVDAPSLEYRKVQPYTVAEARAFLSAVKGTRMEARWVLAVALGLRQGETLGLMWDDVDFAAGRLRVRRSLQYRSGEGLVFTEPKTERSRRTIRLPGSVV